MVDTSIRRRQVAEANRAYRARGRLHGTPSRRAVADALLARILRSRRPESVFAVAHDLVDAGHDADETRLALAKLVARRGREDVDTNTHQES